MRDEEHLKQYVKRVRGKFRLHAAILFGSRARGDHGPWSDYDILLIGEFGEPYLERLRVMVDLTKDIPIPIEPHPYTLEEALKMIERGHPTIVDAIEEGVPLLSGPGYLKLLEKYRALRKRGKLRRTRTSITF